VLNELIMNALSHGLSMVGGDVIITLVDQGDDYAIEVRDNGPERTVGLPPHRGTGMGLQMVRTLVESDLNGDFQFSIQSGWAIARVTFAPPENEEEHQL
jgi:two-component sensor histidine kinase